VPAEVAGPFGVLTGLDVTGIAVHRGPAVSELARAYQARAFTRSGEIFLPDEAGPIEHSDTRALLTHELTHAIQQRILAPALPAEASAHGQELESEASHAEQWFRSGGTAPLRLTHLPVSTLLAGQAGLPAVGRGGSPSPGQVLWSSPALDSGAAAAGVQRQPDDHPSPPAAITAEQQAGDLTQASAFTTVSGIPTLRTGPQTTPSGDAVLSLVVPTASGTAAEADEREQELDELIEHSERLVKLAATRPADLDDAASLEELVSKLYPRLRGLLRGELLVDRERAGLLADLS
jgi:hypothetical protein